jgi:hypothetical protein
MAFAMNVLDVAWNRLQSLPWLAANGLICHTPQPTPPFDDDEDDDEDDNDRGSGGGNIDPDDDEGGSDDDDDEDEDDTLWSAPVLRGVPRRALGR